MSALAQCGPFTFPNGGDIGSAATIPAGARIKNNSGNGAVADGADEELGVLEQPAVAGDALLSIRPLEEGKICWFIAATAFAQFAVVYPADGGKVDDAVVGNRIGVAMDAASGDGSRVRVLIKRNT